MLPNSNLQPFKSQDETVEKIFYVPCEQTQKSPLSLSKGDVCLRLHFRRGNLTWKW